MLLRDITAHVLTPPFIDFFPSPVVVGYADKMAHEKFDATQGFAIDGGIKDATLVSYLRPWHVALEFRTDGSCNPVTFVASVRSTTAQCPPSIQRTSIS